VLPQFSPTSLRVVNVSASAAVGTFIGNAVSATTLRPGVTRLNYDIVGGNVDDRLVVDPDSGQLQVGRPLTEYWRLPSRLEVWIEARDNGAPALFDAVAVVVVVNPVNSDRPRFDADVYNATVLEETPAPVDVVTVTAEDRDVGESGRISYSLASLDDQDASSAFTIDERSGQIRTAARIDRETTGRYQLVVYAFDHVSAFRTLTVAESTRPHT